MTFGCVAIVMGSIHWNQCKLAGPSSGPFTPPPDLPPYIIMTPDAAVPTPGTPSNSLNIWLIVYGSLFIALSVAQLFILAIYEYDSVGPRLMFMFLHLAWCLAWIIYGGILLFGSKGKTCKNSLAKGGYRVYQTSLAMWILMILGYPGLVSITCYVAFD